MLWFYVTLIRFCCQHLVVFHKGFWGDQSSLSLNRYNFEQYCIFKMVGHDDISLTSCLLYRKRAVWCYRSDFSFVAVLTNWLFCIGVIKSDRAKSGSGLYSYSKCSLKILQKYFKYYSHRSKEEKSAC